MKNFLKKLFTLSLIAIAATVVVLLFMKFWDYVVNPWTRDGQVAANVVQVAPRISAPIINLPIRENQYVKAGDLLFEIDPRTFKAALDQARAELEDTGDNVKALERQVDVSRANVKSTETTIEEAKRSISQLQATVIQNTAELIRQKRLIKSKATSQRNLEEAQAGYDVSIQQEFSAKASLVGAKASLLESEASLAKAEAQLGAIGDNNAQVKTALAALRTAELNYEFTKVYAPVNGYVTNINIRVGTQAVANQPLLALVDTDSFWISGFFQEDDIRDIDINDTAIVTLMTYSNVPLTGKVDSLAWGISQSDGSTGFELLPTINPTFEWIRLAERVPVRIYLDPLPEGIKLRMGTTCSVMVITDGTAGSTPPAPAPVLLQ